MKKAKFFIIAFIALFAVTYGMDAPSRSIAEVQVLFTGDNGLKDELFSILNNAKKQVLVAMYWITDESIINKLIELKKKGIDVQVIFDESSGLESKNNSISLMERFLDSDILPVILPSKSVSTGIMHNKFLVVDNALVWTGSANFTKTAFDPKSKFFNNENVVILNSSVDAQKFSKKFFEIEKEIIELYIKLISDDMLPEWIIELILFLYKKNPRFTQIFNQLLPKQKAQLQEFFSSIQIIQEEEPTYLPEEPATYKQRRFLEKENFYFEGMSKQEAIDAIDSIIQSKQQKRSRAEYQTPYPPRTFRRGKPATYNQRKFLEYRRRFTKGMSQREASVLIGRIKQQEQYH